MFSASESALDVLTERRCCLGLPGGAVPWCPVICCCAGLHVLAELPEVRGAQLPFTTDRAGQQVKLTAINENVERDLRQIEQCAGHITLLCVRYRWRSFRHVPVGKRSEQQAALPSKGQFCRL